ncbi:OLC1v1034815C1 [Oldenlandia corymbosa var. corymbosa]|uniref:RING-type E3 ubiquitin transferase n=1 Tax=Oldenlandia corymbosa var. corymbosa TaxID=529605 RepID=A0AAV1CS71_OLDCO|nr:OLC1v1034815C1 [Oldenlandia corymbosa var. corymbosa]
MDGHHGGLEISPLLVGLLGVMAGALIVALGHCLIVLCCNDAPTTATSRNSPIPVRQTQNVGDQDYTEMASSSGSFSNAQLIIACGSSDRTGEDCGKEDICAVCLSEFNQGDEVRVLPGCAHTFHVSCIDKWLNLHRNCPLCRAETLPLPRGDLVCVLPRLPAAPELEFGA